MKKTLQSLGLALLVTIITIGQVSSQKAEIVVNEGESTFLPFLKSGFRPAIGIAPVAGIVKFDDADQTLTAYGLEISLQCPMYQCKTNYIRQQISIVLAKNDEFSSLALELAPHYRLPLGTSLELGVGPHLGANIIKLDLIDTATDTETVFAYGAGTSINYFMERVYFSTEARYTLTTEAEFESGYTSNYNNLRVLGKVGIRF
ncbi:MAG: hypothetical protein V3V14_03375 [Saprospiraceae bacterium]